MKKLIILTILCGSFLVAVQSVTAQKVAREYSGGFSELVGEGIHYLPQSGDEIKIEQLSSPIGGKYISINFYKPALRLRINAMATPSPKDKNYLVPASKGKIKEINTKDVNAKNVDTRDIHFEAFDRVKFVLYENEKLMDVEIIRGGKSQGRMRLKW